ncbi:MgtC/SapB family protein [Oceanobacillus jeddahense]|uniref:MgtC/SapB family protein n=1 Tax=Oceanobacillus jeddahense TaxID=1462527 RepID=A0ABY5JXA2_9BACI|nr:MgtC/SapB family protein [Oceanobacillus jeddahense]UUI05027.1 MgtC/SapB family protein [Oceanobacillus jeddahense]
MNFLFINFFTDINFEFFAQLIVSAILGFIIGLDREYKSKPAGVKTFMYVSVACTLLTIISIESVTKFGLLNDLVRMDPLRLAAQIVSGLGFLGAGVILKDGLKIRGLTSAAMILFAGGVGIGIGAGFYEIVVFAMIFSMVLARLADRLEIRLREKVDRKEELTNKEDKKVNSL